MSGGLKEAAKLLAGLSGKERENILEIIAKKDPRVAELLQKDLVRFEDLIHLTPKMLSELLREIDIDDLGRSLRSSSDELKKFFLSSLSSGMVSDLEKILLGPPLSVSKIDESKDRILEVVNKMITEGKIILDEGGGEYV